MQDGKTCNGAMMAACAISKFLGVLLLLLGLKMLWAYNATVGYMMGIAGGMGFADTPLAPLVNLVNQIVSYSWPVVATLIGLSFLTCFKKCWAKLVLCVYLLLFTVGHLWAGNMLGAIWDVVVFQLVVMMMCSKAMGMMCEKK